MNSFQRLLAVAVLLFPGMVSAAVVLPALDIQNLTGDTGVSLTATTFDIDATAFAIVTGGDPIDIDNESFTLVSTGSFAGSIGSFAGSFVVGGGLLTGTFDALTVVDLGSSNGQFLGDVTYTGGSLQGGLVGGRIEGVFTGADMVAKVGAVVPVPAAVWLFGSGLLGLIGMARRKKAA